MKLLFKYKVHMPVKNKQRNGTSLSRKRVDLGNEVAKKKPRYSPICTIMSKR